MFSLFLLKKGPKQLDYTEKHSGEKVPEFLIRALFFLFLNLFCEVVKGNKRKYTPRVSELRSYTFIIQILRL